MQFWFFFGFFFFWPYCLLSVCVFLKFFLMKKRANTNKKMPQKNSDHNTQNRNKKTNSVHKVKRPPKTMLKRNYHPYLPCYMLEDKKQENTKRQLLKQVPLSFVVLFFFFCHLSVFLLSQKRKHKKTHIHLKKKKIKKKKEL